MSSDSRPPLDLLTTGRVSVDLYSEEPGKNWTEITHFVKSIGGSSTNVAVAAARLGYQAATYTKVGDDPFGDYVLSKLESFGVRTDFVLRNPDLQTPIALAALDPPEDPQLQFYGRLPTAPDMTIEPGELDLDVVRDVPIFWCTGSAMSREPSASTLLGLLARRGRREHTVVDLDYRPMFWPSADAASAGISQLIPHATVAVGNRTECEIAVGTTDPREAAKRLLARGVLLAIVKMGAEGVLAATPTATVIVPPTPITVVCGLGAGDAFGGALVHGLRQGWEPARIVEVANAAGAIVAARLTCSDAMPTLAEIDYFMETKRVPPQY